MHAFVTSTAPNLPPSPTTYSVTPNPSIGIEDIRAIQHFLSRKPTGSESYTVIVTEAHKLTLPAQHAFLKTLEEPPPGTHIYLVTDFSDQLLPTILSRCELIRTHNSSYPSNPTYPSYLPEFLSATKVGERLKLLTTHITTRDQLSDFLDSLEHHLHTHLDSQPLLNYELLFQTRKYLTANCNLKLLLTHLATTL